MCKSSFTSAKIRPPSRKEREESREKERKEKRERERKKEKKEEERKEEKDRRKGEEESRILEFIEKKLEDQAHYWE